MKKSLIYTKGGDKGTTSLVGGKRVPKTHVRLESYGTIDELNSHIGWLICSIENLDSKEFLLFIQNVLFDVGSYLATDSESIQSSDPVISEESINKIEQEIDKLDEAIENVRNMTLEGRVLGSKTNGIYNLYKDKNESKKMVSQPSVVEEKNFNIHIPSKTVNIPGLSDLEYLYAYVIVLENLGFCLFTSFAFLESSKALTLLADMYYYKTGNIIDEKNLLEYAIKSLNNEKKIPNFIKVLYRYFNSTN
jgi:ATP:cob(I)alamin adenosyltransferase